MELSVTLILKLDIIYTCEWSTSGSGHFNMGKHFPVGPTTYLNVPLNRRTLHIFMHHSMIPLTRKIVDSWRLINPLLQYFHLVPHCDVTHNQKFAFVHLRVQFLEQFRHNDNLKLRIILAPRKLTHWTGLNGAEKYTYLLSGAKLEGI